MSVCVFFSALLRSHHQHITRSIFAPDWVNVSVKVYFVMVQVLGGAMLRHKKTSDKKNIRCFHLIFFDQRYWCLVLVGMLQGTLLTKSYSFYLCSAYATSKHGTNKSWIWINHSISQLGLPQFNQSRDYFDKKSQLGKSGLWKAQFSTLRRFGQQSSKATVLWLASVRVLL